MAEERQDINQEFYIFEQVLCPHCKYICYNNYELRQIEHYDVELSKNCPNYGKKFKIRKVVLEQIKD